MTKFTIYALVSTLLIAKTISFMLTPDEYASYITEEFSLESVVPVAFGDWNAHQSANIIQPLEQETLADLIYDQTLTRGYLNSNGDMIMLVLAYGQRQSDKLQVHQPDVCYQANGFEILSIHQKKQSFDALKKSITIQQMLTRNGPRVEPVTYWTRIGNSIPTGRLNRQWEKLIYGLSGKIPDGILVRVSSISRDDSKAFSLHQEFLNDMMNNISNDALKLFVGENLQS